jgi:hypothetical protein
MLSLKATDLNLNFKLETSMEAKLILLVTQIFKNPFYAHRIALASCISETKHELPHVYLPFLCTVVSDNIFPSNVTMDYTDIMASLASNVLVSFVFLSLQLESIYFFVKILNFTYLIIHFCGFCYWL